MLADFQARLESGLVSGVPFRFLSPNTLLFDPALLAVIQGWQVNGERPDTDLVDQIVRRLTGYRRTHLRYLRRESYRLRGVIDINIMASLLIGRFRVRTLPDDPLAQKAYSSIARQALYPFMEIAVRDWIKTGIGGVSLSPYGIAALRAENSFAYPSWHAPEWTARFFWVYLDEIEHLLDDRMRRIMRAYLEHAHAYWQRDFPERASYEEWIREWTRRPSVPVLELIGRDKIYYMIGNYVYQVFRRWENGYGHYFVLGEERELQHAGQGVFQEEPETLTYLHDTAQNYLDIPIGVLERLVMAPNLGFNLLESYEDVISTLHLQIMRGNTTIVSPDLLDLEDPNTIRFLELFKPIARRLRESPVPPVEFLSMVNSQEMEMFLQRLENLLVSVTGVTPYMAGVVGATDVATEVAVMNQQANIRIQGLHQKVLDWTEELIRGFQFYLIGLPEEQQMRFPVRMRDRTILVGGSSSEKQISYADLFESVEIVPEMVGEIHKMRKLQDYQQALQLITSLMPLLAQMGIVYDLSRLADMILLELGLSPNDLKIGGQNQYLTEEVNDDGQARPAFGDVEPGVVQPSGSPVPAVPNEFTGLPAGFEQFLAGGGTEQ